MYQFLQKVYTNYEGRKEGNERETTAWIKLLTQLCLESSGNFEHISAQWPHPCRFCQNLGGRNPGFSFLKEFLQVIQMWSQDWESMVFEPEDALEFSGKLHKSYWGITSSFWVHRLGLDLEDPHSHKFPGGADSAGPGSSVCVCVRGYIAFCFHWCLSRGEAVRIQDRTYRDLSFWG